MEEQLRDVKEILKNLREEFKDEPELLACYEPSVLYLIKLIENELTPTTSY